MKAVTPVFLLVLALAVPDAGAAVIVPDDPDDAGQVPGWYMGFGSNERPVRSQALQQRLMDLRMEDEWRDALDKAERRVREHPGDPEAQAAVGDWYFLLNRLDEAAHHYWRAARLASSNPNVLESFGFVLLALGDHPAGLQVLEQLLELEPGHQRARFNRAAALTHLGRYDEAIEAWISYLRNNAGEWRALYNLGLTYFYAGQNREALRMLDAVQRRQSTHPYVLAAVTRVLKASSGHAAQIDMLTERLSRLTGQTTAERLIDDAVLPVFLNR